MLLSEIWLGWDGCNQGLAFSLLKTLGSSEGWLVPGLGEEPLLVPPVLVPSFVDTGKWQVSSSGHQEPETKMVRVLPSRAHVADPVRTSWLLARTRQKTVQCHLDLCCHQEVLPD